MATTAKHRVRIVLDEYRRTRPDGYGAEVVEVLAGGWVRVMATERTPSVWGPIEAGEVYAVPRAAIVEDRWR